MEMVTTGTSALNRQFAVTEEGQVVTARAGKLVSGSRGSQLIVEELEGIPSSLLSQLAEILTASGYRDGERVHIEIRMKRKA